MTDWDERFRTGDYPSDPEPSRVLREYVGDTRDGRALDIACGTGRNALFLAEQGYEVDALDRSLEGLRITGANAAERDVDDRIDLIQADATRFAYPVEYYDVVTISFFPTLERLSDIKTALRPDGLLFYQHHLRSDPSAATGPSEDRQRFCSNELLGTCLDLTVLYYEESGEQWHGDYSATVELVARISDGCTQSYPETRWSADASQSSKPNVKP